MNKAQKEVELAKLADEAKVLADLKKQYKQAAKDVANKISLQNGRINALLKDIDDLDEVQRSILQSQIYQRKYQEALKGQIDKIVDKMDTEQYQTIADYLKKCYETGYTGTMYDLHSSGIPIMTPINQKQMVKAVTLKSKVSKKLYGSYTTQLKKRIRQEISRGIATASSYSSIANNLDKVSNIGYNKAVRIARTEGHNVACQSASDAQHAAKDAGADIVKQWDAALDNRTRESHSRVDGEIRPLDKPFSNGLMMPGDPAGGAAEVVNCRCALLQRARWTLDESELEVLNERAAYYGLDKTKNFDDFKKKYLKTGKEVQTSGKSGKIELEKNTTKLKGAMSEDDYKEYIDSLANHKNPDIQKLYAKYGDKINDIKLTSSKGAAYSSGSNSLTFNFDNFVKYPDMNKYGTLAHEYGHFFDAKVSFNNVHFKEMEAVRKATGFDAAFKNIASSSDEFLGAIRKDKEHLKSALTPDIKAEMVAHNASHGVQDAVDGLFPKSRIRWGHGERYYNRTYAVLESMDKIAKTSMKKNLQQAYKDLGFDASSQAKAKVICRQYEAASEAWANIMSAEVCGGESLEYVKKYLPNSYKAMMEILKGVK